MTIYSPEQVRRIKSALAETNAKIAKEEARSADLRPAHMVTLLTEWKAHATILQDMLA